MWGQAVATAQISGSVVDPTGAAVPAAKITATQTDTGQVRTTVGGSDGAYVLPNLPVGPYRFEVQASGFTTYVETGIHLEVSDNLTLNVTVRVGAIAQQVEVVANAGMVESGSTAVQQVIDQRNIVDLPLNGRLATQLVMLSGGANDLGPANGASDLVTSKNYFSADDISVAGGQANGTNYLLDGAENVDNFSAVNLPFPFPDAIHVPIALQGPSRAECEAHVRRSRKMTPRTRGARSWPHQGFQLVKKPAKSHARTVLTFAERAVGCAIRPVGQAPWTFEPPTRFQDSNLRLSVVSA